MKTARGIASTAALLLASFALAPAFSGCSREQGAAPAGKQGAGRPPVPVLVAQAEEADVPVEVHALGAVEPVQSSPVRSQVAGIVTEVRFREGDLVKAGQVLFRIDPRPIEATIRQLQANLARDRAQILSAEAQNLNAEAQVRNTEAQARNAETQAKRYEELVAKDLVSREQYDQRVTTLEATRAALDAAQALAQGGRSALGAARAALEATQANLENAQLQLEYTAIKAPVSGRTGALAVDKGDLVKVNDTILVVINQVQPILVRFTVPEARLAEVRRYRETGALKIRAAPPGDPAASHEGHLVFIDNSVDRTTGTIALKAEIDNSDGDLWPGQFVDVSLLLTVRERAVVIPTQGLQIGQQGPYVWVVDGAGVATVRSVTPGLAAGNRTLVEAGLAAGETVVTDGQLRLTAGATVVVRTGLSEAPQGEKSR